MSIAIPNYENKTISNGFILRNLGAVKFNDATTEHDRTNFSYNYNDDDGYKIVENCKSKGYYNDTNYTIGDGHELLQYFYIQLKYGGVIRWIFSPNWGGSGTPVNLFGISVHAGISNDFMGNGNSPYFTYLHIAKSGKPSSGYTMTAADLTEFNSLVAKPTTAQMATRNTFTGTGSDMTMGQGYCVKPQLYGFTTSMTVPNYMQLYYEVPFDKCFNYEVTANRYSASNASVTFNANMHMQVFAWVPADQDVYIV